MYTGGVNICFCEECTFAFYDYRFSAEEAGALYENYRDEKYQKERERHECWYTQKVNDAMNNDTRALSEQKRVIEDMVQKNIKKEIEVALDYGGNEGKTFFESLGTKEKYVFDISGVPTVGNVQSISDFDELKKHRYDFIMANMLFEHLSDPVETLNELNALGDENTYFYIEVPSENPFVRRNKFSIAENLNLLLNPNFSNIRLLKYYVKQRKEPFMPMKEHINFYTVKSMRCLIEKNGGQVIDIQENKEHGYLGNTTVLSCLYKKK